MRWKRRGRIRNAFLYKLELKFWQRQLENKVLQLFGHVIRMDITRIVGRELELKCNGKRPIKGPEQYGLSRYWKTYKEN
jgi:hypothetical protein